MSKNPNKNCLEGFRCPKCGSYAPFDILIARWYRFEDEGSVEDYGDFEWDENSPCKCFECKYEGKVGDFINPGE